MINAIKRLPILVFSILLILLCGSFYTYAKTPYYIATLPPGFTGVFTDVQTGDKFEGTILIKLVDDIEATFRLDFDSLNGGVIRIGGIDSVLDMATWINFPQSSVVQIDGTAPGIQTAEVPFEVTIPEAIMPGDYIGVLTVGLIDSGSMADVSGVKFTTAIGLNLKFSIAGERIAGLDFMDMIFDGVVSTKKSDLELDDMKIKFKYKNTGNSALKVYADVVATDMFGEVIYNNKFNLGSNFPTSEKVSPVILEDIGSFIGWVDVDAHITYSVFTLDGDISDEEFSAGHASLRYYSFPWLEIIIVFSVIVLVLLVIFYKIFRVRSLKSISKVYTVKKGDTLQSVCEKFKAKSSHIIIVNKLKRPYFLESGKKLFIPQSKKKKK